MEFFTAAIRDLPLAGSAVKCVRGSARGPGIEDDWEKVSNRSKKLRTVDATAIDGPEDGDGWEWIKSLAHDIQGNEDGRLGWKVLSRGEVIHGEEGTGTMQGL